MTSKYQLIQNEAKCLKCCSVVYSRHRHDFRTCACGLVSVDGGMDYIRRVHNEKKGPGHLIQERSMWVETARLEDCITVLNALRDCESGYERLALVVVSLFGKRNAIEDLHFYSDIYKQSEQSGRNTLGTTLAVIRQLRNLNMLNDERVFPVKPCEN